MKVIAINGSPNMGRGNTALILNPFLDGLKEAGAEVELFYTKQLTVNPCQGELNCWIKAPGHCSRQDDMQWLGGKLQQADVWVLATPVYFCGVTGPLKIIMDRMLPCVEPFYELREGHCSHPLRPGNQCQKLVLVSNCGFWEMDNFDPLVVQMRTVSRITAIEFVGALLRPHGWVLRAMLDRGIPVNDVLEAAKDAGRQLATSGRLSAETLKIISRPLVSLEECVEFANQYFQAKLDRVNVEGQSVR